MCHTDWHNTMESSELNVKLGCVSFVRVINVKQQISLLTHNCFAD